MYSRKKALSLARRYRTCPPPGIQKDPAGKDQIQRHLEICPYCSLGGLPEHLEESGEKIRNVAEHQGASGDQIKLGDLRRIKWEYAAWREGFFYSPPVVAVLRFPEGMRDAVRVAQTYPDTYLASPGDLILHSGARSSLELFIETWNIFTLPIQFLGQKEGAISEEVIQAVFDLEKDPARLPEWGAHPRPFTEEDSRLYFRQLEVEVAYTFAAQAAGELMAALEQKVPRLIYSNTGELQAELRKLAPAVSWKSPPATLQETLALARLPQGDMRMAAADAERDMRPANLVRVKDGKVVELRPIRVELMTKDPIPGGISVSGRVLEMPEDFLVADLICLLHMDSMRQIAPSRLEWEEASGRFYAEFTGEETEEGEFLAALLIETHL